jgi:hypothetical protein
MICSPIERGNSSMQMQADADTGSVTAGQEKYAAKNKLVAWVQQPRGAHMFVTSIMQSHSLTSLPAPLREYVELRNATLFSAQTLPLPSDGKPLALPLPRDKGEAIELRVTFPLPPSAAQPLAFGMSVLGPHADATVSAGSKKKPPPVDATVNALVATVHVGAESLKDGSRAGNLSVALELAPGSGPLPDTWQPWSAPFLVPAGETEVDCTVFVDRSVVELFCSRGRAAGLMAYLPGSVENTAVKLFAAAGGSAVVARDVRVHEMGCGWGGQ